MIERFNSFIPGEWKPPLIAAIGMGIGPKCLSPLALEWIRSAQVLAGSPRQLEFFSGHSCERLTFKSPLSESIEEIGTISCTKKLAVLCSGDPLFFGIGRTLAERFGKDRIIVIPNVTSIQTLCARVCENWDSMETLSFHGAKGETGIERIPDILDKGRKAAVITDPDHSPGWIAGELMKSRIECKIIVGEDLGTPSEKIRSFSPNEASSEEFSSLSAVIILPSPKPAPVKKPGVAFGLSDEEFEREAGMITKMEVRAVVLAMLRPGHGQVLWDLGAATGSVSIEAAGIARLKHIFAIEKNPSRYSMLVRNLEKFGVWQAEALCAPASEAIKTLPDPDRIFIGGSGDDLDTILEAAADRLLPGGRVVQSIVVLQTLEKVSRFWKERNFETSIVQLQVNRSVPTGKDLRLESLNPVFIVSAWRG